ncbi:hypothetical protein [Ktedonospora formicarum]|uniref:hypothetical protein n=1 Tax=Ktedonospora formicarum TaxID=2778364 RepID=UPI001C68A837|nr:hypothetical protein [Ktedonospora formicarum]
MPDTGGREAGSIVGDGEVREMRNAYLHEATRNWRAGCCKSSTSWFGKGRMKTYRKATRQPPTSQSRGIGTMNIAYRKFCGK